MLLLLLVLLLVLVLDCCALLRASAVAVLLPPRPRQGVEGLPRPPPWLIGVVGCEEEEVARRTTTCRGRLWQVHMVLPSGALS